MKIRNDSFIKSISILASGSLISQIIILISAPILTRVYSPDNIGYYTYILSIAQLFMAVMNGRYDMAIIVENDDKKVFPLIKLSFLITFVLSFIIILLLVIYNFVIISNNSFHLHMLVSVFFIVLSYGIINILNAYNNRNKEYKLMSSLNVIRAVLQNFGAVILGLISNSVISLIIPYIIGQYAGITFQARSLKNYYSEIRYSKKSELKEVALIHKNQPIYSAPAIFANSFSYSALTIFIEFLYGMSTVGFYSISFRLLGIPLAIVSGNVSKVFLEKASREIGEKGNFRSTYLNTVFFLTLLAVPMVLIMIVVIAPLVVQLFGVGWEPAGKYIVILAPMFGIRFVSSAISLGTTIVNRQKVELMVQLIFILFSLISFFVSIALQLSITTFLMIISGLYSLIYIFNLVLIYNYSKGE